MKGRLEEEHYPLMQVEGRSKIQSRCATMGGSKGGEGKAQIAVIGKAGNRNPVIPRKLGRSGDREGKKISA